MRTEAEELARRRLSIMVWRTAAIEIRDLTYSDAVKVIAGTAPDDLPATYAAIIRNVALSWRFLLAHDEWAPDWQVVSQYNHLLGYGLYADPGKVRTSSVRISGTDWIPPIPSPAEPERTVSGIMRTAMDPVDRATALLTRIMRGQWFNDGNKRTALMCANHSLVHDGVGLLAVREQDMALFVDLLIGYDETGDDRKIRSWLARNAIEHLPD